MSVDVCPVMGCTRGRLTMPTSPFCAVDWKRTTVEEKRAIGKNFNPEAIRQVVLRFAQQDGYIAPDPLARRTTLADVQDVERIPGARSVEDV